MMGGKPFQRDADAVQRSFKISGIQIHHGDGKVVAVMKFFVSQQAALQAID